MISRLFQGHIPITSASWLQMCPGLVAAASTEGQKHLPSRGFPHPCKRAALGTSRQTHAPISGP